MNMVYLAPITRRDPLCGPESVVKLILIENERTPGLHSQPEAERQPEVEV